MTTIYEVQTYTLVDGWVNCWHEGERLLYFKSREEAQKEIDEHLADVKQAVEDGDMEEEYDADDYRIEEISVVDAMLHDVFDTITNLGYHCPDVMRKHGITDDEDLTVFAIEYLRANVAEAMLKDMEATA